MPVEVGLGGTSVGTRTISRVKHRSSVIGRMSTDTTLYLNTSRKITPFRISRSKFSIVPTLDCPRLAPCHKPREEHDIATKKKEC